MFESVLGNILWQKIQLSNHIQFYSLHFTMFLVPLITDHQRYISTSTRIQEVIKIAFDISTQKILRQLISDWRMA